MIKIGIDTGGTFTDLVVLDDESGEIRTVKVPSTPDEPALAPLAALREAGVAAEDIDRMTVVKTSYAAVYLPRKVTFGELAAPESRLPVQRVYVAGPEGDLLAFDYVIER